MTKQDKALEGVSRLMAHFHCSEDLEKEKPKVQAIFTFLDNMDVGFCSRAKINISKETWSPGKAKPRCLFERLI